MSEVTKEQIEQWKAKYGKVMKLSLSGIDYYYRPITLDEYLNIQKIMEVNQSGGQVETAQAGVLFPKLPENPSAGIALNLSEEILKISGFLQDSPPVEL